MFAGRGSKGPALIASFVAVVMAGCSRSSGSSPPPEAEPEIVAFVPANGAVDVDPALPIKIVLAQGSDALAADDVVVTDGGNVLPGTLARVGASSEWLWTPAQELPRRAQITVTVDDDASSSFTVRDFEIEAVFDLPGEVVDFTLSWPNGRRALVAASGRCFEVTSSGLVERFVSIARGARPYGDGDFIAEETDSGVHYCVRGNLDGTIDRVPTPLDAEIGGHNQNGDVVVYVPTTVGVPSDWGLWRLLRGDAQFSFAGSILADFVWDHPCIHADGTVALAYSMADRVRLSQFPVGNLLGVQDELNLAPTSVHYDAGADGRGVMAIVVAEGSQGSFPDRLVLQVARYEPGGGLVVLSDEVRDWPFVLGNGSSNPFWGVHDVVVGELGSACVVLEYGAVSAYTIPGLPPEENWSSTTEVIRVEPDDRISRGHYVWFKLGPERTWGTLQFTPNRAEVWGMSNAVIPTMIGLGRSRPGENDTLVSYKSDATILFGSWSFSVDDSARAVLGVTYEVDQALSTHVLLLN